MKLTIDREADALYLRLRDAAVAETREAAPGVIVDYDSQGQVVGVEVLYLSRLASESDLTRLMFETVGAPVGVAE